MITGLFGCIECGQGFKRYEDLVKHQESSGHGVDHMLNLRSEKAIYGDLNVYLDETVNREREPRPEISDFWLLEHQGHGPLPEQMFKRG